MTLRVWLENGWLENQAPTPERVAELLEGADRDIEQAASAELVADWKLTIAHSAVVHIATVALLADGYRATRDNFHMRVIDSLRYTLQTDIKRIATFQAFRKKRNIASYESVGAATDGEANEMLQLAVALRADLKTWLLRKHRDLLPDAD
jgi:hypothetical protein